MSTGTPLRSGITFPASTGGVVAVRRAPSIAVRPSTGFSAPRVICESKGRPAARSTAMARSILKRAGRWMRASSPPISRSRVR